MKKVIMIAGGGFGKTALNVAKEHAQKGIDIEIVTPEEAKERGLNIKTEVPEMKPLTLIDHRIYEDRPPPTRAERRKQARTKRKKRKR
ncbi:hypothetical protein [Thalassobellus citreus]|uniref:hypothetical protein n=1 Tax=Thalassobellus citreus TaxID=3367752 RepID=UPI0037A74BEF